MAQVGVLRTISGGRVGYLCPGCKQVHGVQVNSTVGPNWGFNDNYDRPTLSPSVLVRGTKPLTEEQYQTVMRGERVDVEKFVCHSWVEGGRIRYLDDCTHALAGQTVDMEPYRDEDVYRPADHKSPDEDPDADEYEPVPEFKQDADGNDIVDDDGNKIPDPDAKTFSGGQAYRLKIKPADPAPKTDPTTVERTVIGSGGVQTL